MISETVKEELINEFLNVYFLRPENAFMTFRRAISIYESGFSFKGKSLELSVGDGVFSFIVAGGKFSKEFDIFIDIDNNAIFNLIKDKKTDIFDSKGKLFELKNMITKKPSYKIDVGTDWKENLLKKASNLGLYNNLLLHNNNEPLPFDDNSFDTIYSNSVYWVDNIELHLKEICRVLKKDGELLLQIKTNEFIKLHPYNWNIPWLSKKSLEILDRGRFETWKSIKPIDWYIETLEKNGLKLLKMQPVYSKEQVYLWNIGIRPIAHFLIYLFNELELQERTFIKEQFINYIKPLITDISKIEPSREDGFEFTLLFKKM